MSSPVTPQQRADLQAYSEGRLTALALRRRLDGATYGDILRLLSEEHLPLPRAPELGREEQLARARKWLFLPSHSDATSEAIRGLFQADGDEPERQS